MKSKLDGQLNLILDLKKENLGQELNIGYEKDDNLWEVIFFYVGNHKNIPYVIQPLKNGYAIGLVPEIYLETFSKNSQVIYVEKSKPVYLLQEEGIRASCMLPVSLPPLSLKGNGVYVAVIDTGIDIFHPDFIDANGNTKIAILWDQTIQGNPPEGYQEGSVFTENEINEALQNKTIFPSRDTNGHGTAVASVCGGNKGVASEAKLLIVKLGNTRQNNIPTSADLMKGIDFVISFAESTNMPVSINISYGNNYGDHMGNSIIETYIDQMANTWKNVINIGTGNEGDTGRHKGGSIKEQEEIALNIAPYEENLSLQLWKVFRNDFDIILSDPSGIIRNIQNQGGTTQYDFSNTKVYVYYGMPTPNSIMQELFFYFVANNEAIDSGQWKIALNRISGTGEYNMWLPVSSGTNRQTRFLQPTKELTLTIPSTARKALSAGSYDLAYDAYSSFSGRGSIEQCVKKPDLVAPGEGIVAANIGGGQSVFTGTSFATPFVTGAGALMMEWGIVRENDASLYGEKIKAYLQKGAKVLPGIEDYPNNQTGYGKLCILLGNVVK